MTDPQPLTAQQLDEIATTDKAATPGPWTVELEQCDCSDGLCHHGTYVGAIYADGERREELTDFPAEDWQFIIRARAAVPALLADNQHLRQQLAALASHWEQMASQGDTTIGTFDGPAAATIDAEVSERGNTYRQAAEDLREVLVTGRIPNDLMADDGAPAAARPAATTQDGAQ